LDKSELGQAGANPDSPGKLRILLVVNHHWDPRLGAVRVFMELAEQWRKAGHIVESYSVTDAFPGKRAAPALAALRQLTFGYKAAAFVTANAARFDVVDALIGSLHGSKPALRLEGLLVARSVGLYLLYERFDHEARRRWPVTKGNGLTRLFYNTTGRWFRSLSDRAVRHADLVNVPNPEEKKCLQSAGISAAITVQPYGLSAERRTALGEAAAPAEKRLQLRKICFVGMWAPRKGSRDWPAILRHVWKQIPETCFCFLGTMVDPDRVLSDLGLKFSERISSVPEYSQADLPSLLSECAIGGFPSYVEGFGIAILEQLGAGIPAVAFDVAGPRDMLSRVSPDLLVPSGDLERFAEALLRLLRLDAAAYRDLSARCRAVAGEFEWSQIASETAQIYQGHLARMRGAEHGS
jgi:glycosyltransferase involved in cell wall biosynthesis